MTHFGAALVAWISVFSLILHMTNLFHLLLLPRPWRYLFTSISFNIEKTVKHGYTLNSRLQAYLKFRCLSKHTKSKGGDSEQTWANQQQQTIENLVGKELYLLELRNRRFFCCNLFLSELGFPLMSFQCRGSTVENPFQTFGALVDDQGKV